MKTKAKGNYKDMPRNAIPLRDMVIVWNIGGKVAVTTADSNQYPDLIYSSQPVRPGETVAESKLRMLIQAWHLVLRDGVNPKNVHRALSAVPAYREMLSDDFKLHQS